jgi:hypothetical protein
MAAGRHDAYARASAAASIDHTTWRVTQTPVLLPIWWCYSVVTAGVAVTSVASRNISNTNSYELLNYRNVTVIMMLLMLLLLPP